MGSRAAVIARSVLGSSEFRFGVLRRLTVLRRFPKMAVPAEIPSASWPLISPGDLLPAPAFDLIQSRGGSNLVPKSRKPLSPFLPKYGLIAMMLALAALSALVPTRAQERKPKVPLLDKITTGTTRRAFSGRVQSVDLERKVLNVNTVEGGNTEIFPIKKGVSVRRANGEKLKLAELAPGTNVLIYYEQKHERRAVKEILVLAAGAGEEKKKKPPPS